MYHLTPYLHSNWTKVIQKETLIKDLLSAFGSPLNLVIPENAVENFYSLNEALKNKLQKYKIYFAIKANKSESILRELSKTEICIDVASIGELKTALSNGLTGSRIEATGPKNSDFLVLAIQHNVAINVDDVTEIEIIKEIVEKLAVTDKIKIIFRLNEFSSTTKVIQKDFRFGNKHSEILQSLQNLDTQKFELLGFSMHIPSTNIKERVIGLENLLDLYFDSIKIGFNPKLINIGGAFANNFLESESEWHNYITALKESVVNKDHESMTWNNSGLGFWSEEGKLRGSAKFSDFYIKTNPAKEIEYILNQYSEKYGSSYATILNENNIELVIEPGRAMLQDVGITAAKIINIKKSLQNETLFVVDMNRSNLNSQDLEFMSDPIVISTNKAISENSSVSGFIAGNLCLPHDFISRRKVFFKQAPQIGDILLFINTAAYFMDFGESETLRHPVAKKIALKTKESIEWFEDTTYSLL